MSVSRSLRLKLESTIDSVDAAELIASGLAREAGHDASGVDNLGLAVREAMVNAVVHGNRRSVDKSVHFGAQIEDNCDIRVSIRDEGGGFDPEEIPDPTETENLLKSSGRGLLLIHALVDDVDLRTGSPEGTEIVLTKRAPEAKADKEECE